MFVNNKTVVHVNSQYINVNKHIYYIILYMIINILYYIIILQF